MGDTGREDRGQKGSAAWLIGLVGGVIAAVAVGLAVWWSAPGPVAVRAPAEPPAPEGEAPSAEAAVPPALHGELRLRSGETLEIEAAALPRGRPLVLQLDLPVPSESAEPLAARVLAEGRDPLVTDGAQLADDGRSARVEVDADWLTPGRYVVEIRTTERSHIPLRRYAIEIR